MAGDMVLPNVIFCSLRGWSVHFCRLWRPGPGVVSEHEGGPLSYCQFLLSDLMFWPAEDSIHAQIRHPLSRPSGMRSISISRLALALQQHRE